MVVQRLASQQEGWRGGGKSRGCLVWVNWGLQINLKEVRSVDNCWCVFVSLATNWQLVGPPVPRLVRESS